MKLKIRYYGALTDITNCENEVIELMDEQVVIEHLKFKLEKQYPDFANYSIIYFANNKKINDGENLTPMMELDCMPPFSGG